jgi:uncharacterized protein (DUF1501 family)
VHGVGYNRPSFSHFTSMSFWHTAAPNSGNEYGWVGRTAADLDPKGVRENMIVNIAESEALAVKGPNHVPLVGRPIETLGLLKTQPAATYATA